MRLVLIILGTLVALILLAVATVPLWLGAALGSLGPRFGLTFGKYERVGYSRFALRDVAYRTPTINATLSRVELTTPVAWLWQRTTAEGADLTAANWKVEITASNDPAAPESDPSAATGWMPLRATIQDAIGQLDQSIDVAQIGNGTIIWPGGTATVAATSWKDRTLSLRGVTYQEFNVDAEFAAPVATEELKLSIRVNDGEGAATLISRGNTLSGSFELWDQPGTLSARFGPEGWIPEEAGLVATNWILPGERLKLGEFYQTAGGSARVTWRDERFSAVVDARGTPVEVEGQQVPPLDLALRASGDLEEITVEEFRADLPGLTAALNAPFAINREGQIEGEPARLHLAVDLAQQPWFTATGTINGEAQLTSGESRIPNIAFQIEASEVVAEGVEVAAASLQGRFDSPRLLIESGSLEGSDGTKLSFNGGYDTEAKEIIAAALAGEISRTTLARWLPEQPAFERVSVDATAEGLLPDIRHRGSSKVAAVTMSGLKPVDVVLSWNGVGRVIEKFSTVVSADDSELSVSGSVTADAVRLTDFAFAPNGATAFRLQAPATFQWSPTLRLDALRLEGPDAALHAGVTWGTTGRIEAAVRGVKSDWLTDFSSLPARTWEIASFALTGSWDDGPMTFSTTAGATLTMDATRQATVHLDARGDAEGVQVNALRAGVDDDTVVNARGFLPATITPGAASMLTIDSDGRIALDATTAAHADFWREFAEATGLTLTDPRVFARLSGTWTQPEGELQISAGRIALEPKDGAKALPPVDNLDVRVVASPDAIVLETLALSVASQTVSASGRLPVPARGWETLRENPLEFVRKRGDFRIQIPDADLAAFNDVLPEAVLPQGRAKVAIALENGQLNGSVQLEGAATRPLGPAGALRDIQVDVQLEGQNLIVRSISAETGGETVRLTGRIGLPDLNELRGEEKDLLSRLNYDLELKGANLPFVRKTGLLVRGDVDVTLTSPESGTPQLGGTVRLRDSLFLQDLRALLPGDTRSKSSRPPYFAVEVEPFEDWRLAIDVVGTEFMRLRATGFTGVASARFQLGGTLGEPRLLGDAIIDRGQVRFPFASFEVQTGRVSLTRANPFEPQIELTATTRRYEFDLRLEVTGDASDPEVKFTSSPPLEHGQVLQMVLAGIVPNTDVTVTQQQRVTRLGAYLGQNLLSSLGDGDDSSRLSITTGEDISEQGRETYRFDYSLSEKWALTGEYDEYDTQTFGVKWRAISRGGSGTASTPTESTSTESAGADGDSAEAEPSADPAKIDVKGLGFFGDREMEASLRRLLGTERLTDMDTNATEDALFLLMSAVKEKGYLNPTIELTITTRDGEKIPLTVGAELESTLPRALTAREVTFQVNPGLRYLVDDVQFDGLEVLPEDRARAFFAGDVGLFSRKASRVYTPARLARSVESLAAELRSRGYAEARVNAEKVAIDEATGAVSLSVQVNEGPRWHVATVAVEGVEQTNVELPETAHYAGIPWTESVEQDISAELRKAYLAAGYPDVRVRIAHTQPEPGANAERVVPIVAQVNPGRPVTLGEIRYEGLVKTRESVLDRRVQNEPGEPLNLLELERARYRMSRLGIFERIDLELEPEDGAVRDAVFSVEPGRELEVNVLAGYNTYEQLRAGVEVRRYNIWGRAHQTRALLAQSLKSSRGEYTYTVPELLGEDINGTARLFGLQREEVAFLRKEYGLNLSVDTPLSFLGATATAGYTYEVLRNEDNELETSGVDQTQVEVASVHVALTRDRRDNPLLPRQGYRLYGRAEAASQFLGGRAEYQRFEFGGSHHIAWGEGRWWHFAGSHGVITTFGDNDERLPVNRRFYPGGDGSIRGYNNGEAAPRGADDRFMGAKAYTQLSVEFEQALVQNISGVLFVDAMATAAQLADYPFQDTLVSVGLGVRYRTVVGPIRVEYGHNLNPRQGDPSGTFLFSIGFPF